MIKLKGRNKSEYKVTIITEFKNNTNIFSTISKFSNYITKVFDVSDSMISTQLIQYQAGYRITYTVVYSKRGLSNKLANFSEWITDNIDIEYLYSYKYNVVTL